MKTIPALFVLFLFVLGWAVCVTGQASNARQDEDFLVLSSSSISWEDDYSASSGKAEDPFGNILNSDFFVFDNMTSEFIETSCGKALKFTLTVSFPKEHDEGNYVKEAWVYFIEGYSGPWIHVPLERQVDEEREPEPWIGEGGSGKGLHFPIKRDTDKETQEIWSAEVNLDEFGLTPDSRIVYLFRAKDHFGNIVMELPDTNPGWPPNTNSFFPGAGDIDNSEDIVPADFDILDTFIARDQEYIYLASRYDGNVSPGNKYWANGYVAKFADPKIHSGEGLAVGLMQAFVPLVAYPHDLIDISKLLSGNSEDADDIMSYRSRFDDDGREYSVGIAGNTLYSRTNIKAICPKGCESLRVIFFTLGSSPTDIASSIPYNCAPFTVVYFRVHTINMDTDAPAVTGDTIADPLPAPAFLFPDNVGAPMTESELVRRQHEFEKFTGAQFYGGRDSKRAYADPIYYEGPDPIRVKPGDVIFFGNYKFEVYDRNNRVKVRLFSGNEWWHTIMIGSDTKPTRDEQHYNGDIYITFSNFSRSPLSCDFSIRKSD